MKIQIQTQHRNKQKKLIVGYFGYWVKLTYLNLISSALGIYFALIGDIKYSLICLMISGALDMIDGRVARIAKRTKMEEYYGIQLDSLADIIAFGMLPAIIGYSINRDYLAGNYNFFGVKIHIIITSVYLLSALIRLAHFNVVEIDANNKKEKVRYYEGLPTTTVALIIPVIYSICNYFHFSFSVAYYIMLIVMSIAFLIKIQIPKPNTRLQLFFV